MLDLFELESLCQNEDDGSFTLEFTPKERVDDFGGLYSIELHTKD